MTHPTAPRSTRRFVAALGIAVAFALPSLAHAADNGSWFSLSGVIGSGRSTHESRSIGDFQAVAMRGSGKLVLRQGSRVAIDVQADDNVVALIETRLIEVNGTPTLEIRHKPGANFVVRDEPVVTVDVAVLKALTISGSAAVTGTDLAGSALHVTVSGSGDVDLRNLSFAEAGVKVSGSGKLTLAGKGAKLSVSISGSGDVDTLGLKADEVSVGISGSGNAKVDANRSLAVSISGSGDVSYTGGAVPSTSIAGHGHVTRR